MAGDEDLDGQENDAQKIKRMMEKMESIKNNSTQKCNFLTFLI